jgi:baculoviral IAP repeat-containing protein 6
VAQVIREACIKWAMLDQMRRPQPEFKDVITAHFKLRGPALLRQTDVWIEEAVAAGGSAASHAQRLRELRGELEKELAKL